MIIIHRMRLLLSTLTPATAALLLAASTTAAQTFPTDADVERYVREIHAQVRNHGRGELPYVFFRELDRLGARFGLAGIPLSEPQPAPPDLRASVVDSLLRAVGPAQAYREALRRDSANGPYPALRYSVAYAVRRQYGARTLLDVVGGTDFLPIAVAMQLHRNLASRAALEDTVHAWLADAGISDNARAAVRADLLQYRLPHDHDATMAVARADPHPGVLAQVIAHSFIYTTNFRHPDFDAALDEGLRAAFAMPAGGWRNTILERYADLCTREAAAPCARFDLPRTESWHGHIAIRALNAAHDGDLALVDSLLAELEADNTREPSLMALVSTVLTQPCEAGIGCEAAVAPLRERWLPRLQAFAPSSLPEGDTVRANLVVALAAFDGDAAVAWLAAVQDSTLAYHAAWIAQSAASTNFWTAVELLRTNARRGLGNEMPPALYTHLMSMGETELAGELLESVRSSHGRLQNRLQWVEALHRVGRVEEARTLALSALDDWDTEAHPVIGSGAFRIYEQLGIYSQLIDWAWSRPEGPARAGALLSVLIGLGRVPD
jgi:hypothetical protein